MKSKLGVRAILILAFAVGGLKSEPPVAEGAVSAADKSGKAEQIAQAKADKIAALKKKGFVPLEVEAPPPTFVFHRTQLLKIIDRLHVGPDPWAKRELFYVPPGLKNVALGKKATSGLPPTLGDLEQLTDGDKSSKDGHYIELGPGRQHVQIDLGWEHEIFAIVVWHYIMPGRVYFDVEVQCSNDPGFIIGGKTLFNNDHDDTRGRGNGKDLEYIERREGKLIGTFVGDELEGKGAIARYIRLHSNGNTWNELNHYLEVEVWGRPAKKIGPEIPRDPSPAELAKLKQAGFVEYKLQLPRHLFFTTPGICPMPPGRNAAYLLEQLHLKPKNPYWPKGLKNVALKKKVAASDPAPVLGELEMITDGEKNGSDGYYVEFEPGVQCVQLDLERKHEIFAVIVWHYHQQNRVYCDIVVQCADDAEFATGLKTLYNNDRDNSVGLGAGQDWEYYDSHKGKLIETFEGEKLKAKGVETRFIRLYGNGSYDGREKNELNHYIEVEVWGRPAKL